MAHKCGYCEKEITTGTTIEGIKCTCDKDPETCEVPESVICGAAPCQFKLTTLIYKQKMAELKAQCDAGVAKLKELNNIYRIMGVTPKSLELLIRTQGVNLPNMMVPHNPSFSWDQLGAEEAYEIGSHFMHNAENQSQLWAQFIHEKSLKIVIKKQDTTTKRQLDVAKKIREGKYNPNETPKPPKPAPKPGTKMNPLNPFEKLVKGNMLTLGLSQPEAEELVKKMGLSGVARNLKEIGAI